MSEYIQGRVTASGPDEASMKIRDKHGEGELTILEALPKLGIYEYMIRVG